MRRTCLAVALLMGASAAAQDRPAAAEPSAHEQAIAAIRKLGGEVKVNPQQAGEPVSVILTGSSSPTECLPYLDRVNNLHTCDL